MLWRACATLLLLATLAHAEALPTSRPVLKGIADLDRLVPKGVVPRNPQEWTEAGLTAASQALSAAEEGTLELTVIIDKIHSDADGPWFRGTPVDPGAWTATADVRCQFVDAATMSRLAAGDRVTLSALVNWVALRTDRVEGAVVLDINLTHARFLAAPQRGGVAVGKAPAVPPVIDGSQGLVAALPDGAVAENDTAWNDAKFRLANERMIEHARGRLMRVAGKVKEVVEEDTGLTVRLEDADAPSYVVRYSFEFTNSATEQVIRLKAGQDVIIEGTVRHANFVHEPDAAAKKTKLKIALAGCRLKR
jgi:hypothetical protein